MFLAKLVLAGANGNARGAEKVAISEIHLLRKLGVLGCSFDNLIVCLSLYVTNIQCLNVKSV